MSRAAGAMALVLGAACSTATGYLSGPPVVRFAPAESPSALGEAHARSPAVSAVAGERVDPGRSRAPGAVGGAFVSAGDWSRARAYLAVHPRIVAAPEGQVRVVIVPHHWLAGHLIIAAIDAALVESPRPLRVILLSPDHRHVSRAPAMTTTATWSTLRGMVSADVPFVTAIARSRLVALDAASSTEHGLGAVMPVLAERLPGVPVVPVAVRSDVRGGEVAGLASVLAPAANGALIVASVDFSHGLPVQTARRMDGETLAALERLDITALLSWGPEHLDGSGALSVALRLARERGARDFQLGAHSDSNLNGGPAEGVTTYVVGFVTGP